MTAVLIVLGLAAVLFPMGKVIHRTGYNGWWVLLWFVPVANLIGLWVWAYSRWPALDGRGSAA
jgi:hypothetical protein